MTRYVAIIPAAGSGTRFGAGVPKQYTMLAGAPMLYHAVRSMLSHAAIETAYVVLAPADSQWQTIAWGELAPRVRALYCGGETRAETVGNALAQLEGELQASDWVLVHDAARPCLRAELLERCISELRDDDTGGLLAVPMTDTLKRADGWQRVESTEPRERLWRAQTPQMFRYGVLRGALASAPAGVATDESWAVERLGLHPRLVVGEVTNFKVTYAEDVAVAEQLLRALSSDASRSGL